LKQEQTGAHLDPKRWAIGKFILLQSNMTLVKYRHAGGVQSRGNSIRLIENKSKSLEKAQQQLARLPKGQSIDTVTYSDSEDESSTPNEPFEFEEIDDT
jgi:hypothetical protein